MISPSDLQEVVSILERAGRDGANLALDDALDRLRTILRRDACENELDDRSNFGMVYVDMDVYDDERAIEDTRRAAIEPQ